MEMLKFGCTVEKDSDGDWIIWAPADVTIFSVPGEGVLLSAATLEEAIKEAREYLEPLSESDVRP